MPRTREQIEQAARAAEKWLDTVDPSTLAKKSSDSADLRRIGDALANVAEAEASLTVAVAAARNHGRSWSDIAIILGTSRQAARQRYSSLEHKDDEENLTYTEAWEQRIRPRAMVMVDFATRVKAGDTSLTEEDLRAVGEACTWLEDFLARTNFHGTAEQVEQMTAPLRGIAEGMRRYLNGPDVKLVGVNVPGDVRSLLAGVPDDVGSLIAAVPEASITLDR